MQDQRNDYQELCAKLYASQVKNRLHELESASDDELSRWIWELIQNAKDCSDKRISFIPNKPNQNPKKKNVDIRLIITNNEVVFKHNGYPFIKKTLDSLMYRFSGKKSSNESTGRFGTGFMTSHTLSRIVQIEAPYIDYDGIKKRISATVFREGRSENKLCEEFTKMEGSKILSEYNKNNPEHKWTSFSYTLTNNISHKSLNLGVKSFHNNIIKTLLFCPEIKSIQINDETPYSYKLISSAKYNDVSFQNQINIERKEFKNDNETHQYIVFTVNEINDEYSKKYANDNEIEEAQKSIVFSIAFEIDSENKLIYDQNSKIRLFCTFPLIGSSNFQLPFILNSPIFEVLTERNGIVLDGDSYDPSNILTNRGLNEIILLRSIALFKIAMKWLIENNYSNFHILAKDTSNTFTFSNKIINTLNINQSPKISDNIKNILEESQIVKNSSNQPQQLISVFFLNFNGVKNKKEFHSLASQFYLNIVSYDDCENWGNLFWNKLHVLSLENFIEHISSIDSYKKLSFSDDILKRSNLLKSLNSLTNDDYTFLLRLYSFLLQEESIHTNSFLRKIWKYPIVLNSKSTFSLINKLKYPNNLPTDLNTIMNLCQPWGYKLLHPKINNFASILPNATINDAQNEINSFLLNNQQNIDLLLSFIKFIPDNSDKQLAIYKLSTKFFSDINNVPGKIDVHDVDENLWEKVNFYLLKCIKKIILSHDNSSICTEELEDYNNFYDLYQKICHDADFLVPNYNLVLKNKNNLKSIESNIPQIVLDDLRDFIHIELYAHPLIKSVKFKEKLDLNLLISNINKSIDSNDNILSSILSFFPPKGNQLLYNIQEKISKIAPFFLDLSINQKQTNIVDEKFWFKANEIVRNRIKKKLELNNTIDQLENDINKNKSQIFEYLNIYISVNIQLDNSNWKTNTLIPNYFGNFRPAKYLSTIKNVPEHYVILYNIIKNDSNIEDSLAHSQIKCEYLEVIDLDKFIKMICQNISDRQLIYEKNIHEAIFRFHPFNSLKSFKNNLLLEKLYTANIYNKLDDLKNPTENDKKRWVWELMQYALDSINGQNKIDVTLAVNNQFTELIFSHNGRGFDETSLLELIFAINPKENRKNAKRFGSGFFSTHVLSKKVEISGNVISQGKPTGFSLLINREGTCDESIVNDFRKIHNSCQSGKDPMNLTSIKYAIQTQENSDCLKAGLEHIENHIYQVLINCPQIKSVHIKKNGTEQIYSIPDQSPEKISNFLFFRYRILEKEQNYQYIVLKDEANKINISVKLNEKNEIVQRMSDLESIFAIFPLTGSQKHVLPYFLNSPEIIPTNKCDSLVLNGSETNIVEKNRSILIKSIDLYKELIIKLNEQKCPNIHEMSIGLLLLEKPYHTFDLEWYQNNYLVQMRDVLSNFITIQTYSGSNVLLKDAYFPDEKIEGKEMLQDYIALVHKCFHNNIINVVNAELWKNKIWETAHFINVDNLIDGVKSNQELLNEQNLTFFNEFLKFIWKYDHTLLYKNEVIPDMNNQLHCYPNIKDNEKEEFHECKNVSNDIIEIMESIKIPWRKTHMNNAIHSIPLSEDKQIDAQSKIIERIRENNDMCFILMKFVEQDDKFRIGMFDITNQFFSIEGKAIFESSYITKNIDPFIWEFANSYVLRNIANTISKYDQKKVCDNLSYFKKFIHLFMGYFKKEDEILKSAQIIPNKIYQLKSLKLLSNALVNPQNLFDIHEYLNQILKKYLNKDLDEKIIHPVINEVIKSSRTEEISDFMSPINNFFLAGKNETNLEIAKSILSLIPENKKNLEYYSKQEYLFQLYNNLFDNELEKIYIDDSIFSEYWNKSNTIIIAFICNYIQETQTLSNFQQKLQNEKSCFDILNLLYEIISKETKFDCYKIVPNAKGDFMKKSDLRQNPEFDEQLINCINYLDPDFLTQSQIADSRIKINGLQKFNILDFYQKLNKLFNDALKNNDEKAYEMIKKINGIDDSSFLDKIMSHNLTNDEKLRMDILINAHINFLENYLREVDFKSEKEKTKWPYELIQNANDTVQDTNKKVDITFEFTKDKIIFIHNGEPFQNESLLALLYQTSYGKKKKSTTGKFGTGFLSTMVLSRKIQLTGDLIIQSKDCESVNIKGFEVTIFRDGSNSTDLREGIKKMEKSLKKGLPRKNKTQFEYYLEEGNPSNAIELGLQSLKENISAILILNPSINSITIKKDDQIETYELNEKKNIEEINNDKFSIQTVSIQRSNNNEIEEKFFVVNSMKKYNNEVDTIGIDCLVRIGDKNNIISAIKNEMTKNKNEESKKFLNTNFFSSYPMFGSNNIKSPFIINSKYFELDRERKFLLINSDNNNNNQTNENLINKFIINESVGIYKQMIKKAIEMKCKDLFNLFACLKEDIQNKFIQDNFIVKLREIACALPVFETSFGLKLAKEVYIPYFDNYEDFNIDKENDDEKFKIEEEYNKLISNFQKINSRVFVTPNDGKHWKNLLWGNFPSLFKIDSFYKNVPLINHITSYNSSDFNVFIGLGTIEQKKEYIKNVFNFVKKQKNFEGILLNEKILVNENGEMVNLNELYHFELSDITKKMLKTVKYDVKAHSIHHDIANLCEKIKLHVFSNDDAFSQIQKLINDDNAPEFMKYVIKNDSNREIMYNYTKLLLLPNLQKEEIDLSKGDINKIPPNLFKHADYRVAKMLSNYVNRQTDLSNIEASSFIKLLKKHLTSEDFEKFDKEKFYHTKCLDFVEKDLMKNYQNKYSNIQCVSHEKVNFDPNNKKFNIEAMRISDNHKFYFIVKQSEYFSFRTVKYISNKSNTNEHYVLSVVFNIDSSNPNVMNFELINNG